MRRKIKKFLNSYVTNPTRNDFELRIRDFIKQHLDSKTYKYIQVLLFVALILFARNFGLFIQFRFVFFIIVGVVIALIVLINKFKKNQRINMNLLFRATNEIRNKNYSRALDYLLDVYSRFQNEDLWLIILEFSEKYGTTDEQQAKMNSYMMENEKDLKKDDPKLFEILKQIKIVADYIAKHKNVIVKSKKKIVDLEQQLLKTKELTLKSEYQKLIKRYEDIIDLENSKIQFYQKAQNELFNLKENHIVTHKLLDEKQELEGLENSLLEKSILESYNSEMTIDDFISYESSYLEAIKEYSETVSNSSDQNLFEDVIQNFKDKTEFL